MTAQKFGTELKVGNRRIWLHKSIRNANITAESVLTHNIWQYVELWLKRSHFEDALVYWRQSKNFADAAQKVSIEAMPLLLYYCCLNASKALLMVRGDVFNDRHGVSGNVPAKAKTSLENEKVSFKEKGILPAMCKYYGDDKPTGEYSLKLLFWNLPFLHRAFVHTFQSTDELFIPIEDACYVRDERTGFAWFRARLLKRYSDGRILKAVPKNFQVFEHDGVKYIRSINEFKWHVGKASKPMKAQAYDRLQDFHSDIRRDIVCISGNRDLWYLRKASNDNHLVNKSIPVIIFAAMHRFSELARYEPLGLSRHLSGKSNWLITEFLENSLEQFLVHIACEITGSQIMKPNIRG